MGDNVKVYTVNGQAAGSSSSIPDWLTRKRSKPNGKRAAREHYQGTIELLQDFEFPEASNKIRSTRDGTHIFATGTYKPQIRVWDLGQLSLKFERHTDSENVDFVLLSDDWTKSIHLQNDRSVELHNQGGSHYRTRIPRFGRSIAYHFPSCDAYLAAAGNEVYRLNLDQGRFMTPLSLQDDQADILGVNVIDINPVHQLLALGIDGSPSVQFWDPRSKSSLGTLRLPENRLSSFNDAVAVTAIASRMDGLSYAIGTSSGHTLLYDIRSSKPFAVKDQGYGLPIQSLIWIDGGDRMAGDGLIISADKKVIKIWDKTSSDTNFASITPATDLNDVHHVPGSGLLMTANEGIHMASYFVPQLGPAPKWASFLENITEEMEDTATRSAYQDFKFIEKKDLSTLGLDHLIGTPTLKPYMHGYFVSLKLYDTARLIANPFAYAEHREKLVKEKMDKMAGARIRASKNAPGVKVNKALAEKILKDEEKERKKEERKSQRKQATVADVDVDMEPVNEAATDPVASSSKPSLLSDPRFTQVFEDAEFAIDEESREYALLNPSTTQRMKFKTAVEEDEESDASSLSDGFGGEKNDSEQEEESFSDSSDEGVLTKFDPRSNPGQRNDRAETAYQRTKERNRQANQNVNFIPMKAQTGATGSRDGKATFGQRRGHGKGSPHFTSTTRTEMTWTPSTTAGDDDDANRANKGKKKSSRKGMFLEKGSDIKVTAGDDASRSGREKRRRDVRSGSKSAFRKMHG